MNITANLGDPDIYSVTINGITVINLDYKAPSEPFAQLQRQQP